MKRSIPTLLTLLTLLAACGSDARTDAAPEPVIYELPTGADEIVLQVDIAVNAPDPFAIVGAYPRFTLYGDGLIIFRDHTIDNGSLPPLMQARISRAGMQLLVAKAARAEVFGSPDTSRDETLADGDSISIVANTTDSRADFSIGGNTDLRDLTRQLEQDWAEIVGDELLEEPALYEFESLLVIGLRDRARPTIDSPISLPIDLSTDGDEYDTRIDPITCAELSADEFDVIRSEADNVGRPNGSTWISGNDAWFVLFRPVFPHEPGCSIIPDQ